MSGNRIDGNARDVSGNGEVDAMDQGSVTGEADRLIAGGHLLEDGGDIEGALACYRQAAVLARDYPRAYMNVGNALRRLQRWTEAISAYRQAIACSPSYAPARFNLGALLADRGDAAEAEAELLEVLRVQPSMIEALVVLADIYESQERFDDAEKQFERALDVAPAHAGTLLNFGMFCFRQGRFDETHVWLQRARAADPNMLAIESFLLMWANYRHDSDSDAIAREHVRVGKAITRFAGSPYTRWPNVVDATRRLRVGYVSGDFMPHPVALFMRPILERHDVNAFDIYCYSNYGRDNPVAKRLRQLVLNWRDIANLDDQRVANLVRDDQIDVLVDLSGHTDRHRLAVFARHPAPVQVTWLGYLNSTGISAMDYRICDRHTDPAGVTEHLHVERLVRMPHSQWCYAPWEDFPHVPHPHVDRPEALVFGSFNQSIKITEACVAIWSRILGAVPNAELVILDVRQRPTEEALRERLARHGINPARVTVRGRESLGNYFKLIGNVDIALDAFPYNGATTTLDTLWMGVPLVALRGERGISRGSYSILTSLGADELIAHDVEEWVAINTRLAQDGRWRAQLRESLRPRLVASPLMDASGFVRSLEERYHDMWRAWCRKATSRM